MNLWIRSQNREFLTKVNSIDLAEDCDKELVSCDNGIDYLLGKYKTKERALEVLDEIQEILTNRSYYIGSNIPVITKVYEMPQE